MDYDLYYSGLTFYFMYMIEYPWDGPTSWIFTVIIFLISPLCGVAQTPDCGMLVVLLSFISPLCGVAPTPDCGIIISAFSARGVIQTLVWHQYYYFCIFRSRSHSDTRLAPSILFWYILTICVHHDLSYISWQMCVLSSLTRSMFDILYPCS